METVALFDEKGGLRGFWGSSAEGSAGRASLSADGGSDFGGGRGEGCVAGSVKSGGGVIALSVDRKEVTEVGRAFSRRC